MKALENEGIRFSEVFIDKTLPKENAPTRKPGTGLLTKYFDKENYNLTDSFVIGDRITDMELAKNLSCKGFWLNNDPDLGANEISSKTETLRKEVISLETKNWKDIYEFLQLPPREVKHSRNTNETKINIQLNLDGAGNSSITTGLGF